LVGGGATRVELERALELFFGAGPIPIVIFLESRERSVGFGKGIIELNAFNAAAFAFGTASCAGNAPYSVSIR
jgi:hypothetical protein